MGGRRSRPMSQRNLLILVLAFAISYACYVRGGQNPYERYVSEGLATIEQNSLEAVPSDELFHGAMDGMVKVLEAHGDSHSKFLDEKEAEPLRTEIHQQFGGIGVRIGFKGEPPQLMIMGPPDPDSPAAREDLQSGDRILSIDGQPTDGMTMENVLQRVRGRPGTPVELTVQAASDPERRTVRLVREVINIESVLGDRRDEDGRWQFLLEDAPEIAHIRIMNFGERTPQELERILRSVIAQGAKAAVLDLRDNPGGALESAVAICDLFLPANKLVVETRGRNGQVKYRYETTTNGPFLDLPLAVLVNQDSASAAEIVAACLQDHHRAVVGGQRSYGKGTVQQLVPMEAGKSLLKVTWASFWRPSDTKINRDADAKEDDPWGVVPDDGLEHHLSKEELEAYRKSRDDRDRIEPSQRGQETSSSSAGDSAKFVDEQLQLVVDALQNKIAAQAD